MSDSSTTKDGSQPSTCTDWLAAVVKAAEDRRELLMNLRDKSHSYQDRDNLQRRALALDDMAEVIRDALKAANDRTEER